jgi:hypothetical protein
MKKQDAGQHRGRCEMNGTHAHQHIIQDEAPGSDIALPNETHDHPKRIPRECRNTWRGPIGRACSSGEPWSRFAG